MAFTAAARTESGAAKRNCSVPFYPKHGIVTDYGIQRRQCPLGGCSARGLSYGLIFVKTKLSFCWPASLCGSIRDAGWRWLWQTMTWRCKAICLNPCYCCLYAAEPRSTGDHPRPLFHVRIKELNSRRPALAFPEAAATVKSDQTSLKTKSTTA